MLLISGYSPTWRETDPRPTPGYQPPTKALLAAWLLGPTRPKQEPEFRDLTGSRFGLLTAIEQVMLPGNRTGCPSYRCRCDCKGEVVLNGSKLLNGSYRCCGRDCPLRRTLKG